MSDIINELPTWHTFNLTKSLQSMAFDRLNFLRMRSSAYRLAIFPSMSQSMAQISMTVLKLKSFPISSFGSGSLGVRSIASDKSEMTSMSAAMTMTLAKYTFTFTHELGYRFLSAYRIVIDVAKEHNAN